MHWIAVASGVLLTIVAAPPMGAQQALTLRFRPHVHQVEHYRFRAQTWAHVPGLAQRDTTQPLLAETMYTTRTVTGWKAGMWTVRTYVDSAHIAVAGQMGQRGDLLAGTVIRQMLDSLGRAYATTVTPPPGASPKVAQAFQPGRGIGSSNLAMPAQPVRPGQSWVDSTVIPMPGGSGTFRGRTTYRLERVEHEGGDRVAVVSSTMSVVARVPMGSASGRGVVTGRYRVDLDGGRLLRATTDMTMRIKTDGGPGSERAHSVIELLH
ncbi:MAG: hypothetical protein ACRENQ_14230 [Gemmatimonadaceae bacterium]